MKRHCFTAYPLFALLGLILSPLAVVYASPSPADSVHFCLPFDYERWQRNRPLPAAKQLATLDAGEPRTVRMIYFLPNDRPYRAEVVQKMKDEIVHIQTFYAEQMQAHGHGNTTFLIETDAQGEPRVHRVNGRHPNSHYLQHDTADEVLEEIDPIFDIGANVYLIVVDSRSSILSSGDPVTGVGGRWTKNGGFALIRGTVRFDTAAHELGHAFGLAHDFRGDTYIMSYEPLNSDQARLSACNAEFLAVHTYFNRNSSISTVGSARPTSQLISPHLYPPGSTSVPVRLRVSASKGLHQAILLSTTREPHAAAGFSEVQECRGFTGQKETVARFEYDGTVPSSPFSSLSDLVAHRLSVDVVDADGNLGYGDFGLAEIPPYHIATLTGHVDRVHSVLFLPDGNLLISGSLDNTIRLWDVAKRQRIATLTGPTEQIESIALSPDGTLLASGSGDDSIELWDVASRQKVGTLDVFSGQISFSPGTLLAAWDRSIWVALWDVASRQKVGTLKVHGGIRSVAFSPGGTLLAIGTYRVTIREPGATVGVEYEGNTVELWDVAKRQRVATLTGHTRPVSSVVFSPPDGTLLASGSWDNTIRLWDVAKRQRVATLTGHTGSVSSVAFSPDGTLLASGSNDNTIRLWDVASTQQVATIAGHGNRVNSVAFSPDGTLLASGSDDNTIGLWDMSKLDIAQTPHSLTKVSGDGQEGPANTRLVKPFVVSVLNQDDSPLTGVRVVFSVTAGGGLLSPTSDATPCAVGASASSIASYTNAKGQASIRLTLSSQVKHSVKATVEGLEPVIFAATKSGQAMPHRLTKVCGDSQEGIVDEQLAESFVVSVSDEHGAAIAGVAVSFAVTAGGGTLSSATATTNANGRAATRLTLGSEAGTNTVEATGEGLEPVTFTATGQEDPLLGVLGSLLGSGKQTALPDRTQLLQNTPNPFNSQTILSYFLLEPGPARLEVFALTGQRVAVLHQGPQQAGYHRLHWDGRDAAGRPVASGMYLYRLVTAEDVLTRKLVLLR